MAGNNLEKKREKFRIGVEEALRSVRERPLSSTLSGRLVDDKNFSGRKLLVVSSEVIYSVSNNDILAQSKDSSGFDVVQVRAGAQLWTLTPTVLPGEADLKGVVLNMELQAPPPPPKPRKYDPKPATAKDIQQLLAATALAKSIAGAAAQYSGSCSGGDKYENNCAHYLSDAFIRAGYTELLPPNDCVNARCNTTAKRVIRAKDMWCWFKSLATESRTSLPKKEGFWAVFQLKESEYCCGHVVIIDTDTNKYYGTGNYPHWDQYAYKW